MFTLLKRKPSKPKPKAKTPAGMGSAPSDKAGFHPVAEHKSDAVERVPTRTNGQPQLLRARHVMSLLGVSKTELRKFIDCALLTPRYLPDPHRTGGRNAQKHQRAWFLASEVQSIIGNLKPASPKS